MSDESDLHEYLLRLGDDALVAGHRLSEWAAMGPFLEEDLAITNLALDLLGHAQLLLDLAAALDERRRTADELVFFRDVGEYRNMLITEAPVAGNFALTIVREFVLDAYRLPLYSALAGSSHAGLAAIAGKIVPELRYHVRHTASWVVRLGDGTSESNARMSEAWMSLYPYLPELFDDDPLELRLTAAGIAVARSTLADAWLAAVRPVAEAARLPVPPLDKESYAGSGRLGRHTEHLGRMLSEMQSLARAHPGAKW